MSQSDYVSSILNDINSKTTKAQPTKQKLNSRTKKGKAVNSKFQIKKNIPENKTTLNDSTDSINSKWDIIKNIIRIQKDSSEIVAFEPAFLACESICHSNHDIKEVEEMFLDIITEFTDVQLQQISNSSTFEEFLNKANILKLMSNNVTAIFAPFEVYFLKPKSVYQVLKEKFHKSEKRLLVIPYITKGYCEARNNINNSIDCSSLVLTLSSIVELLSLADGITEQLIKDQYEFYSQIIKSEDCAEFVKWSNNCETIENNLLKILPANPKIKETIKDSIYGEYLPKVLQKFSNTIIQTYDFDLILELEQLCSYKDNLTKMLEDSLSIAVAQKASSCFKNTDIEIVESLISQIINLNEGISKCTSLQKSKSSFDSAANSSERSLPFLLSYYVDHSLRHGKLSIENTTALFKEVFDADSFLSFHRRLFAFRIADGIDGDRPFAEALVPLVGAAAEELLDAADDALRWSTIIKFSPIIRVAILPRSLHPELPALEPPIILPFGLTEIRKTVEKELAREGKRAEWCIAAETAECICDGMSLSGPVEAVAALFAVAFRLEGKEYSEWIQKLEEIGAIVEGRPAESGCFVIDRPKSLFPRESSQAVAAEASEVRMNRARCAVSRACKKLRRATREELAAEADVGEDFLPALEYCIAHEILGERDGVVVFDVDTLDD